MPDPAPIVQRDTPGRPRHSTTAAASGPVSEETRAFLQQRVGSFGLVLALIFGVFFTWRSFVTLLSMFQGGVMQLPWRPLPFQGATSVTFLTLWLICRGAPRSVDAIRRIEAACLVVGFTAATLMAFYIPYSVRPDYILLLSLSYVMVVRAVWLPASARQSVAMCALVGVPLLVTLYFVHLRGHDPAHYAPGAPIFVHDSPASWARQWTFIGGMWWAATTAVAGATSHVIYGLRKEVRDARRLGQYTLLEKLGEGGMGTVYRASHAMLRRPAAIKLLPPDKLGEQSLARFEREVQLTAMLSHPNTVRVFDYGRTADDIFYYAMEMIDGGNLAQAIAVGGPMPGGRVIHILDQVCGALIEAHGIGLIHRDIKPANILLTDQGGLADVVKVVDFGLVKRVGTDEAAETGSVVASLTQAGGFAGTPQYMAPEAITQPESVDGRTDLYALGAVGYYLLTGADVFTGVNIVEVCSHHLHTAPVPPSQRLGRPIAPALEQLILACLEKNADERPPSARDLQRTLRDLRDAHTWTDDDARAWWTTHAARLRAKQIRSAAGSATTVAVDLEVRPAS